MDETTPQPGPTDAAAEAEAFASSLERPKRTLFRRRPAEETAAEETGVIVPETPVEPSRQLFRRRPAATPDVAPVSDAQATEVISASDIAAEPVASGSDDSGAVPASAELPARAKLTRERRDLVEERQESVYHLGGLAFELHRRGSLPTRVMRLRADEIEGIDERVRSIDADLGEIDRQREEQKQSRRERTSSRRAPAVGPAGMCAQCGTGFVATANFCANCGEKVEVPMAEQAETQADEEAAS